MRLFFSDAVKTCDWNSTLIRSSLQIKKCQHLQFIFFWGRLNLPVFSWQGDIFRLHRRLRRHRPLWSHHNLARLRSRVSLNIDGSVCCVRLLHTLQKVHDRKRISSPRRWIGLPHLYSRRGKY